MALSGLAKQIRTDARAATVFALLCVAGSVAAQTSAPSAPAAWFAAYQRDGRPVRLPDGRTMNLYCLGKGSPTVVLESGIGGGAYDWWAVQDRIAGLTRVCAYDRAGIGRSPPGPFPRDTRAEAADLDALLRASEVKGPYVLVGHSMGGYNVRLFASRHPDQVAGMVLVDPAVENQIPVLEAAVPAIAENDRKSVAYIGACADPRRSEETARRCGRSAPASFPPDLAAAYASAFGLSYFQTFQSEVQSFLTVDSGQVAAERRPLGDMPFIVLTRGERSTDMPADQAATEWRLWNQMHDDLARLSTAGENRVVAGANHYIQFDKPDAVVGAVGEVVAAARKRPTGGG